MNKDILEIIERIKKTNWFSNIDSSNNIIEGKVSFEFFKKSIDSLEWENTMLEHKNNFHIFLREKRISNNDTSSFPFFKASIIVLF